MAKEKQDVLISKKGHLHTAAGKWEADLGTE